MKTLLLAAIRCSLMFGSPKLLFAKSIPCTFFAVALVAWSPLQTRADTIAFSVSSTASIAFGDNTTLGYAFTVSSPVTVTNLGLFDFGNDGLNTSHAVTIWTSTGTQLLQVTIPAGTGATLTDGFRYVSIAPFLLVSGTYTIGGFYAGDSDSSLDAASITSASGLSYLGSRSAFGFTFPSGDAISVVNSYFGPNFQFITGVGVPTPDSGSTVSLLGFALLGLAAVRRKLSC
jgi:protein with PEP-CTERM/exosortase system signal